MGKPAKELPGHLITVDIFNMENMDLLKDAITKDIDDPIISRFAEAVKSNDLSSIESTLNDSGTFEIRHPEKEKISVNKRDYIMYLAELLNKEPVTEFTYDRCLYCSAGHRVILFNGGRFPFNKLTNHDRREKTGFRLESIDGKINDIKFCFSFIKHDNRAQFEVTADRIKSQMKKHKWSFDEAYQNVFKNK